MVKYGMNKQRQNCISLSSLNQAAESLIYYLVKASDDLKNWPLLSTALYLRQFFTYCFDKKKTIRFSRYTRMVVKKIQGNRNKICRYKMTKLVRSYSVAKGQEGLTVHFQ